MLSVSRNFYSGFCRQFSKMCGPVETSIRTKLFDALKPVHLEVINESYMHNVPKEAEMHFKVVVVSKEFEGVSLIQRHRRINAILEQELLDGLHALSIVAKTPEQWKGDDRVEKSPACLGGFGK